MSNLSHGREQSKLSMAIEVLQSFGEVRLQALGVSMLPTLWPGDRVTIQAAGFDRVGPGDIVLCARQNLFFTHRVTQKSEQAGQFLITQGDAMVQEDPPVSPDELLGKVITVYRYGNAFEPARELSETRRLAGILLCRWNLFRSLALRLHAWRANTNTRQKGLKFGETTSVIPQ